MSLARIALLAAALGLSACNAGPRAYVYAGGSQASVQKTISVPRGATASLGFGASINPDCTRSDVPDRVTLTQAPSQGRVEIRHEAGYAYFRPANPRSRCNTTRVPGTKMFYHASPNASGTDTFSYDWYSGTGGVAHFTVTVNIL
ncbi:hypothetical protein [Methylosinus sp. LW4]|uniref:hypothetical protein n=1 Tax=Methylosinus sp. LW4 TaxID=136993 RepID=UPI0003AA6202|nr:hypothetical protein [Methylosinus sp. LW4]